MLPIKSLTICGVIIAIIIIGSTFVAYERQQQFSKQMVAGVETQISATPTLAIPISITPTITPRMDINAGSYEANMQNTVLHDCVVSGKVLQLTYADCEHQLNEAMAQDEQNQQYILQNYQNSFKEYANDQKNIWTTAVNPSITPIDVSQDMKDAKQEEISTGMNVLQTEESEAASTCEQIIEQNVNQLGQQRANEAAMGFASTSGVEQSQEKSISNQVQERLSETFTSTSNQLTANGIVYGLSSQANELVSQLKGLCTL